VAEEADIHLDSGSELLWASDGDQSNQSYFDKVVYAGCF
jgi:hypothetical protein